MRSRRGPWIFSSQAGVSHDRSQCVSASNRAASAETNQEENADERPEKRAAPPGDGGPTYDDGGDGLEFETLPRFGIDAGKANVVQK